MSKTLMFITVFILMSLQGIIAFFQYSDYRKTLKEIWSDGGGIVGVGHTKGIVRPGQILLLKYDKDTDKVVKCYSMKGLTVLARFREVTDYNGMSLQEVRELGLELDSRDFKHRRKKHPYDPEEVTKKKHALIQAVEAIERRIVIDEEESRRKEIIAHKRKKSLAKSSSSSS